MAYLSGIKKKYGLSIKIAVLPMLGLIGLFLVKGMDIYVGVKTERAFVMGQYGSDVAWHIAERTLTETAYLNTNRNELLDRISDQSQKIDNIFTEWKHLDSSAEMQGLIREIKDASVAHQKAFDEAAVCVRNLAESKAALISHFNASDNLLRNAVESIIEEETQLTIIQGMSLPEKKMALRSGFEQIMGFTASAMLNLNELLMFSDAPHFEEADKKLEGKMEISFNNTLGVVLSVNEEKYNQLWEKIVRHRKMIRETRERFYNFWKQLQNLSVRLDEANAGLKKSVQAAVIAARQDIGKIRDSGVWVSVLTVGITVLILTILSTLFIRSITRLLSHVVIGLNDGAGEVANASANVLSASQQLAEEASGQWSTIEKTASSVKEISAMTRQNAYNANQADALMQNVRQVVEKARESMEELTFSMEEMSNASREISKIIKMIDDISFQTNLLALNAAVEAARAGEAGAGFAVVADEVRNLAARSANAAKSTSDLIEHTVMKIRNSSELVVLANKTFSEIALNASEVGELIREITTASGEQDQGIEIVNRTVTEMEKMIQKNVNNSERSAGVSQEMNTQAEQMKGFVDALTSLVGGGAKR
ncbi:methyl-accepting chemotaxis protein [Desulfobacterales bacterium HSG2]|nr:methyl-accepting chemotaxis protein [Desulfobacterales bacterium HSG2]